MEVREGGAEPDRRRFCGLTAGVSEESTVTDCSKDCIEQAFEAMFNTVNWLLIKTKQSIPHTMKSRSNTKCCMKSSGCASRARRV